MIVVGCCVVKMTQLHVSLYMLFISHTSRNIIQLVFPEM